MVGMSLAGVCDEIELSGVPPSLAGVDALEFGSAPGPYVKGPALAWWPPLEDEAILRMPPRLEELAERDGPADPALPTCEPWWRGALDLADGP